MNARAPHLNTWLAVTAIAALGLVIAAYLLVVVRLDGASGPSLVVDADGSTSGTLGSVGAKEYRSAYFASICVSAPGEITIRSIEPVEPVGGLRVTDFSVVSTKSRAAILGAASGRLRDEPSYLGTETVTASCSGQNYADLFVELYKPRPEDASAGEFTIKYDSDGDHREAPLLYDLSLCEGDDCGAA